MLKKSKLALIAGVLVFVNASMSRSSPGTAAEMSFSGPRAERIDESSNG